MSYLHFTCMKVYRIFSLVHQVLFLLIPFKKFDTIVILIQNPRLSFVSNLDKDNSCYFNYKTTLVVHGIFLSKNKQHVEFWIKATESKLIEGIGKSVILWVEVN